jgi:hypothetical protein
MLALGGAWQNLPGDRGNSGFGVWQRENTSDAARHKLHCMNLTHAAAVAFATGVIPAQALK